MCFVWGIPRSIPMHLLLLTYVERVCTCLMICGSREPGAALSPRWARSRPFFLYAMYYLLSFSIPIHVLGILGGACCCCCRCVCVELLLVIPTRPLFPSLYPLSLFGLTLSFLTLFAASTLSCPSWTLLYNYNIFFSVPILHALSCVLGPPHPPSSPN